MDVTEAQWASLELQFLPRRREDGRARPWQDTRAVLNGVLWILRTGVPWHDLPPRYPPYQTCHRRFQQWQRPGLLTRLLQKPAEDLRCSSSSPMRVRRSDRQLRLRAECTHVYFVRAAAIVPEPFFKRDAFLIFSPFQDPVPLIARINRKSGWVRSEGFRFRWAKGQAAKGPRWSDSEFAYMDGHGHCGNGQNSDPLLSSQAECCSQSCSHDW
jgi:transposase